MKRSPFVALWGWPIALAVLTATGLATALVSDTWGDWWSWVGLGVPVAVMGWYAWPRAATAKAAARRAAATGTAMAEASDDASADPDTDGHAPPPAVTTSSAAR